MPAFRVCWREDVVCKCRRTRGSHPAPDLTPLASRHGLLPRVFGTRPCSGVVVGRDTGSGVSSTCTNNDGGSFHVE